MNDDIPPFKSAHGKRMRQMDEQRVKYYLAVWKEWQRYVIFDPLEKACFSHLKKACFQRSPAPRGHRILVISPDDPRLDWVQKKTVEQLANFLFGDTDER